MSSLSQQHIGAALKELLGHVEYQRLIELGKQAPPEEVELVCPRCAGAGWLRRNVPVGHPDFGMIVECTCGLVAGRRTERYLGRSKIPVEYAELGIETYPDGRIALAMRKWFRDAQHPWLFLVGDAGVGKTGLAIGLVKLALSEGRAAVYRPVTEMLADIRATFSSRDGSTPREAQLMEGLKGADLLVIDDLGTERMTGWVQERMYEILNYRHNEHRRTILTTNLGPDELRDQVGDRILSRIVSMGWRYEIVGRNLRLRGASS